MMWEDPSEDTDRTYEDQQARLDAPPDAEDLAALDALLEQGSRS